MCTVDTCITCHRYTGHYHHLPSSLYAGEALSPFPVAKNRCFIFIQRSPQKIGVLHAKGQSWLVLTGSGWRHVVGKES